MPSIPPPDLLQRASLFLDFDGTLTEIADRPDRVRVDEDLLALLDALKMQLDGRVALVSGRAVDDLAERLPGRALAAAGSHGCEFVWPDGRRETPEPQSVLAELIAEAHVFARTRPGVLVEPKPLGVAIHYRQAPHHQDASHAFADSLLSRGAFVLQPGRMVIELKPAGADKGGAVRRLMRDAPFSDGVPVFVGDDRTDEAGFIAVREMGGAGILVGPPRETAAMHRLPDVNAVRRWLGVAWLGVAAGAPA